MQLAQGLSRAGGTGWREKRKEYGIAADGEAEVGGQARSAARPGALPSLFCSKPVTHPGPPSMNIP